MIESMKMPEGAFVIQHLIDLQLYRNISELSQSINLLEKELNHRHDSNDDNSKRQNIVQG
jgi:hypothetical protein